MASKNETAAAAAAATPVAVPSVGSMLRVNAIALELQRLALELSELGEVQTGAVVLRAAVRAVRSRNLKMGIKA